MFQLNDLKAAHMYLDVNFGISNSFKVGRAGSLRRHREEKMRCLEWIRIVGVHQGSFNRHVERRIGGLKS